MYISRPDPIRFLTGQLSSTPFPQAISSVDGGGKFTHQGEVLTFPGNTFICHIDKQSRAFSALVQMQREIMESPHGRFFTFLPPQSFHMTIFQGVTSVCSSHEKGWPKDIPFGEMRDDVTARFVEKLADQSFPSRVAVSAHDLFTCHSLTMTGASEADEKALRAVRDQLSEVTSIRFKDHDRYIFHVTLAYLLQWVDPQAAEEIVSFGDGLFARYSEDLQSIPIGPIEFCNFETMHHFEPVSYLKD
ncbi:DUF1868 domain-containing protein [uncultured Cohaesibacter sp.]|uniref:DUF1868 domain-containing protein n=1 Tax=uncultured Cohaesibacter sp. TaxID=1002546 RepID=UPI00292F198F|nr:DUF1868 domain-containing protein [uncultured Cohaesibacter sp.]